MSWSVSFIGAPVNVAAALEAHGAKLEGQSKLEYDAAAVHLIPLIKENFGEANCIVKLVAGGSGYAADGEQKTRNLTASIERIYGTLV